MTTPLPDAAAVRRALERRFRIHGPSAEEAMVILGPVLGGRDEELTRLRGLLGVPVIPGEDGSEDDVLGDPPPGALL